MERWASKVAVVTGVTSGIGAALAQVLVRREMVVVGLCRKKEKAQELAESLIEFPDKFYPVECDVSKEESILAAFAWIRDKFGTVDVLVNNAGITKETTLIDGTLDEWREVINVNILGLCLCTREAVRSMREENVHGVVIHVGSFAGERVPAVPGLNVDSATKRATLALAETLRHELTSKKIRVSTVSSDLVATEFSAGYSTFSEDTPASVSTLTPEDVADAVVYVLSTPPHVQIQDISLRHFGESW